MARQPRLSLPHQLHHVLLRGNGRECVFADDADRRTFIDQLVRHAATNAVSLHAWALMPDHVHLLVTPARDDALSLCIQAVGRGYVQAFNRRHGRRGSLWEGRYRSTVLEPDPWLLRAMVWLDTHPQRQSAGSVATPHSGLALGDGAGDQQTGGHPWITAGHYLGVAAIPGLTVPPQYWALGNTPFAREAAYRTMLVQGCAEAHRVALAEAALKGWALGSATFVASLQQGTGRRLARGRPGRPVSLKTPSSKS
jgi:putative transposase